MPIRNPPDLYTGGAVVFNSQPYVNFYERIWARKQAKEAALEEYNRNLLKSINPAGMRTADIPILVENEKNRRDYFQQNRDSIFNPKRDGGRAQTEYQGMIQESFGTIERSKNLSETDKQFVAISSDPTKKDLIDEMEFDKKSSHDLPFNDPNHKAYNIGEISFHPKEMDTKEWTDYYKDRVGQGVTQDKNIITIEQHPQDRFSKIETTVSQYSQPKLQAIADMAKNDYLNDKRLRYSFNKNHELMKYKDQNGPEFEHLRDIYKLVYGKDAEIEDERDLHAAIAVQSKMQPTIVPKRIDDVFKRQSVMEAVRHANDKELLYLKDQIGDNKDANNLWVEKYTDQILMKAKDAPIGQFKTKTGEESWESDVPVDPVLAKAFEKNKVSPIFIRVTKDGKFRITYPETDKDNEPVFKDGAVKVKENLVLDRDQFETSLGKTAGTKQYNIEQTAQVNDGKVNSKSSSTRTRTFKYKGKEITPDKIEKAAKQSGMTVDEYIKAAGIE